MAISLISIFVASVLVLASHAIAGRLVALLSTAVFMPMLAYFMMPPYRSFHIAETHDVILITCFGIVGVMVAQSAPKVRAITWRGASGTGPAPSDNSVADLSLVIEELLDSNPGIRLRAAGIVIEAGNVVLPCSPSRAADLLKIVIADALDVQRTERISIHNGRQPGFLCLFVAAHRVWPPPAGESMAIGRHPDLCTPLTVSGSSPYCRANWFDNGSDRIYQLFLEQPASFH
jgi:hypothetical protein